MLWEKRYPDSPRDPDLEAILRQIRGDKGPLFEKIDYPYTLAKDEIMTILNWEYYEDFGVTTKSSDLYQYMDTKDYRAVHTIHNPQMIDVNMTEERMFDILEKRFDEIHISDIGSPRTPLYRGHVSEIEIKKDVVVITTEVLLPLSLVYRNLKRL